MQHISDVLWLLVSVKKDTRMTSLLEDVKYEAAAKENFIQVFEKLMKVVEDWGEDSITGKAS
jgi:hypothetical protein